MSGAIPQSLLQCCHPPPKLATAARNFAALGLTGGGKAIACRLLLPLPHAGEGWGEGLQGAPEAGASGQRPSCPSIFLITPALPAMPWPPGGRRYQSPR